jgi:hypothetical protein
MLRPVRWPFNPPLLRRAASGLVTILLPVHALNRSEREEKPRYGRWSVCEVGSRLFLLPAFG